MFLYILAIFLPILIIIIYLIIKFAREYISKNKKNKFSVFVQDAEDYIEDKTEDAIETLQDFIESGKEDLQYAQNSIEHAKEILFQTFYKIYEIIIFYSKRIIALILHFVVIVLKKFRDYTDILYSKSRNFFLYTATKEKDSVSLFWKHLKEYKKEADKEEKENK
jgi:hypothetical protein